MTLIICLCLFAAGRASAQWAVIDPSNIAQSIVNTSKNVVHTSTTAQNMVKNFQETVKIYEQGKKYYDALKSVNNLVKDARKVQQTILMVGDITDIYVTSFQKMLRDDSFTVEELGAIAFGYTKLLEESNDVLTELKNVVNITTLSMTDKERSHGTVCAMKNCNGNTLDAKIIEEIRKLSADKETLTRLLAQTKKVISGSKEGYDAELALLREKHAETEDRIKRLVESLSVASETSAKYVMEQIDALHRESETQQARLSELEALTEQSRMLHQEFAFHQEMIESFASAVDSATLEEKRRLLRTIVKKVVWDGKNAYVYLFAEDGEADLPPIDQPMYPLGEDSE